MLGGTHPAASERGSGGDVDQRGHLTELSWCLQPTQTHSSTIVEALGTWKEHCAT